jgi:hypothetical protein
MPEKIILRANTPAVQQFLDLSRDLISAAADYAGGPEDPETNRMLRGIQTMAAALLTALGQASQPRPAVLSGGAPEAARR